MLLKNLRFRIAAEKYGARLPHWLIKSYGNHPHYTEAQLRRAIAENKLNPRYAALAFAAYMDEEAYSEKISTVPDRMDYEQAKTLFVENSPIHMASRHENAKPPEILRQLGIE